MSQSEINMAKKRCRLLLLCLQGRRIFRHCSVVLKCEIATFEVSLSSFRHSQKQLILCWWLYKECVYQSLLSIIGLVVVFCFDVSNCKQPFSRLGAHLQLSYEMLGKTDRMGEQKLVFFSLSLNPCPCAGYKLCLVCSITLSHPCIPHIPRK